MHYLTLLLVTLLTEPCFRGAACLPCRRRKMVCYELFFDLAVILFGTFSDATDRNLRADSVSAKAAERTANTPVTRRASPVLNFLKRISLYSRLVFGTWRIHLSPRRSSFRLLRGLLLSLALIVTYLLLCLSPVLLRV